MMQIYTCGALGGTFDHFHAGHEHFIRTAAQHAQRLCIGVTTAELTQHKEAAGMIQPLAVRMESVRQFCRQEGIVADVVVLEDLYGPTLGQLPIDCLIVTELTVRGGERINHQRASIGLSPLPTIVCDMVRDQSGEILQSTAIRLGRVSRDGFVYRQLFTQVIHLNSQQRRAIQQQHWGDKVEIISSQSVAVRVVVGDVSLEHFRKQGYPYDLGIYDLRTQRHPVVSLEQPYVTPEYHMSNPAGSIQGELAQVLEKVARHVGRKPVHIQIDGEEDLAAVVAIALFPLGSRVYFGLPPVGMCECIVSEDVKEVVRSILSLTR